MPVDRWGLSILWLNMAGILLAIVRPVRVGDQIGISGSSGCIKDIALIYTVLDTTDGLIYVPSILMFSNIVVKKKSPEDNAL